MNEILAVLLIIFDSERIERDGSGKNWDRISDEEIAKNDLIEFLFDPDYLKGDLYACFDRVLQIGVKHLYMDTKDITDLKKERAKKDTQQERKRKELFEFSVGKAKEQAQYRQELEKAYEREKSKVSGKQSWSK